MAGTDNTHCSVCGEGWYDKPDRVGTVCPECWQIQQLEIAAAAAQEQADAAKKAVEARRAAKREQTTVAKKKVTA